MTSPTKATLDREALRRRRVGQGLSQTKLAEQIGVTPATISYLESGGRQASPSTLVRLARALGCEPADLMPALATAPAGA
jgi:transcriptional regulator with XRE-family HTH domain